MDSELVFLKLPPENIVTIKFILESYEGLGILRTLNAEKGELVIIATPDEVPDLKELLASLADELKLREIPTPENLEGDWLLAELIAQK